MPTKTMKKLLYLRYVWRHLKEERGMVYINSVSSICKPLNRTCPVRQSASAWIPNPKILVGWCAPPCYTGKPLWYPCHQSKLIGSMFYPLGSTWTTYAENLGSLPKGKNIFWNHQENKFWSYRGCIFVKGTGFSTCDACKRRFVKIHSNCRTTFKQPMEKLVIILVVPIIIKSHLGMYRMWIKHDQASKPSDSSRR